jgi:Tol biopolymer transport system component
LKKRAKLLTSTRSFQGRRQAADRGQVQSANFERVRALVKGIDGSGVTQLTSDPRFDLQPAWSPDGTKIAFHSNRTEDFEIYAMNADGTAHQKE